MTAALAAIFSRLGPGAPILHCLHVNHNIRNAAECSGDEEAAAALCESLSLPFHICRIPRGMIQERAARRGTGMEAAARRFRYAALAKEARRLEAQAILTAHTRDDRLENILMAVLRGSGPAGLGAMSVPHAARQTPQNPPVIRPLLHVTHEEALAYLAGRGLSYRTDPSNADTRFFRSRTRHLLIPLLNREFPGWEQPLLRLNETQALAAAFLAGEASRLSWENTDGGLSLSSKDFFAQNLLVREEALFAALDTLDVPGGGETRPRRDAVRMFSSGAVAACDLGKFRVENTGGRVRVKRCDSALFQSFSVLIKNRGTYKLDLFGGLVCEVRTAEMPRTGGFYAGLPLVLRRTGQAARIEALDAKGRAALLDLRGKVLEKRNGVDAAFYCTISV
jgi:tRNA(Ile)-lysidine synthase